MGFISEAGIFADMQNEGSEDIAVGADAIAPDESDTLAGAVSEINADEAAINTGNGQIEQAEAVADGMETLAEHVAEQNAEGEGLTEDQAETIELAVECMLKVSRIGVSYKQLGLPSPESFKKRENRKQLGNATCEALRETAGKVWQAIVDAIKKSIQWVVNLFNKIFGAAERLKRRAESLKGVELIDGKPNGKIENESLYQSLVIGNNIANVGTINEINKAAESIFKQQKTLVSTLSNMDPEHAEGFVSTDFGEQYGPALKKQSGDIAKKVTSDTSVKVYTTAVMPGDNVVFVTSPIDKVDTPEKAASIKAGSTYVGSKKPNAKPLDALKPTEINQVAVAVIELADTVVSYKRALSEINASKDKFIKSLEKQVVADRGDDESKDDAKKNAKTLATVFRKLMDQPAAAMAAASVRSASAVLQYAELSARQYDKK